ncbi:MAG: thiamine pyrophosphate-binding protein [Dehalococcoidia bacterium]|nr:thiamine pyrophosphate-binding protein [Dehalococcoidia bacterium]
MNNAELMVRMLERAGVRWAFGIPSGPVLPFIEALRTSSIEYVLTASETSAGFMAATIGTLTGVPGVCISTLGPGATNLATGVGAAWLDRAPVIAITCNVETRWLARRVQMRIDHHALFAPITKASLPLRVGSVAGPLAQALVLACAEPAGPVHLDLPEDVALADAAEPLPDHPAPAERPDPVEPASGLPATVAGALGRSRRPLLVAGLEIARTRNAPALLRFIERQGLPFVLTLHAKGYLPESHANYAGVLGRARRSDIQAFIDRSDLVIAVGYDPIEVNYEEWVGSRPVLHISSEAAEADPSLNLRFNEPVDINAAITALAELAPVANEWAPEEWWDHMGRLETNLRPPTAEFAPYQALDILRGRLPADAILAYDVGAHTHQIATQWRTDLPRTCISTNGWSSMGFGLPAAFAAKLAHPDRPVVAVVGDGCFQMTVGELATARRQGLAAPVVVLNDGWLSLLRIKQEHRGYAFSGVDLGPRVASPPHYFGVPCRSALNAQEFTAALDWALEQTGPSVIEAFVSPETYSLTVYD